VASTVRRRNAQTACEQHSRPLCASKACPKGIEHFGAAEIWGLKLGPEWVGTGAKEGIALPDNVRRY